MSSSDELEFLDRSEEFMSDRDSDDDSDDESADESDDSDDDFDVKRYLPANVSTKMSRHAKGLLNQGIISLAASNPLPNSTSSLVVTNPPARTLKLTVQPPVQLSTPTVGQGTVIQIKPPTLTNIQATTHSPQSLGITSSGPLPIAPNQPLSVQTQPSQKLQVQPSQPQLGQIQPNQPQLGQIQPSQPQLGQIQPSQPQLGHPIQPSQPQLGQIQPSQPQLSHPIQPSQPIQVQSSQPQLGQPQLGQPQLGQPQLGQPIQVQPSQKLQLQPSISAPQVITSTGVVIQPTGPPQLSQKSFTELLKQDQDEGDSEFKFRENYTLKIAEKLKGQITPEVIISLGRAKTNKVYLNTEYPARTKNLLDWLDTEITS